MDPAIHNSNTRKFRGRRLSVVAVDPRFPASDALESIRQFTALFGTRPTAESWTAAGMLPSEKTIRRRFGSFRAAAAAAGASAPAEMS